MAELRRKIDRGTHKLALAEGDNFAAIAKLLDGWRDQERKLVAKLRSGPAEQAHLSPRVLEALANLTSMRDNLHQANRVHLAAALKESIVEIRVGREMRSQGRVTLNRIYGTLTFHPELWSEGPISYDDWDHRPDAHYLKVAKYVQAAGRDVPLKELTDVIGLYNTTVRYHAQRAVLAGLIEPAEQLGNGWRPVQAASICG